MRFTQIKETSLYVEDLNRTEAFYSGKLQLEVIAKSEGRHIFFKAGTSVLLCFIAKTTKQEENLPGHFGEGNLHIAFEVPHAKYEEIKAEILSANIEIEYEQQWSDDYRSFYFRDPDQHSIEIVPAGMWG